MRPQQIVYFERAYLLSILFGLASVFAYWPVLRQVAPAGALVAVSVLLLGGMTALVLLVSRRRSVIAKWVLTAITAVGILLTLPSVPASAMAGVRGWMGIVMLLLHIAALAFLFTAPARAWTKGTIDAA